MFNAGVRPAVNVGLSVSRVGGAAQTKAMKKASGSMRIDLAQYREMEVFTQFSSDLDDSTKALLDYGKCLMELLKQPLCRPLASHEQVITLWVATHKVMCDVPVKEVKKFQMDMLEYFDARLFSLPLGVFCVIWMIQNTDILTSGRKLSHRTEKSDTL